MSRYKNVICILLLCIVIYILFNCVCNQVTEYYEQMDPILSKIRETLLILEPTVKDLKGIPFDSYNFLVAKLAYKIISYSFEFKR